MDPLRRSLLHDVSAVLTALQAVMDSSRVRGLSRDSTHRLENAKRELMAFLDESLEPSGRRAK
ncbi:MAG: hypothetical protein JST54_07360 [Deltaproteobacteria bacterium]|nr:hypothetical protein [Deltaproteobacteria bacterium]